MGSTLERHPFSGLVHSAGELLHRGNHVLAGADSTISGPPGEGGPFHLVCRPEGAGQGAQARDRPRGGGPAAFPRL